MTTRHTDIRSLVVVVLVSTAFAAIGATLGIARRAEADGPPAPGPRCNEQSAQDFLVRGNFVAKGRMPPEERRTRAAIHERAIRYRTEQYGYFEGFGSKTWNPHPPSHYAEWTRFRGLRVRLHRKIIPALGCVERELETACASTPYAPRRLSGLRDRNTYHTGEITNHVYGIAIDIDPTENTCCNCVAKWREHPLCKRRVSSVYERMIMPECWVHVFERFGFYWLGHDQLQDTMHFEFLGDPARILAE